MSAGSSHLVENPYAEGNLRRQAIGKGCFDFLKKLPDSFGGATNFLRAPWARGRAAAYREELHRHRTFAAVTTVLAASLVATNLNARITVAGFMIFIVASIAWMIDGWLETKASLVIQNVILLVINVIGVWRWFPKAEKEAKR